MKIFTLHSKTILLLATLLIVNSKIYALIPTNVSANYTVSTNDMCLGNCTVQSGITLTVNSNAIATFNGNITVMPGGVLDFNQATVKMASGKRIILRGQPNANTTYFYIDNSTVTSTTPGVFWSGIEAMKGTGVYPTGSTIEYASTVLQNYNADDGIAASYGGHIWPISTTFQNNTCVAKIYNETEGAGPMGNPGTPIGMNWNVTFQRCHFIAGNVGGTYMILLNGCKGISFLSCDFTDNGSFTYGIYALNSSIRAQPYYSYYGFGNNPPTNLQDDPNNPRCKFHGFRNPILISNALQTDLLSIIMDNDFYPRGRAVELSGCVSPWIVDNKMDINNSVSAPMAGSIIDKIGLSMTNCTGYKVEGNELKGLPHGSIGILVQNSGAAYNEIYRNNFPIPSGGGGVELGVQAIGNNRNFAGSTGLKILCNNINGYTNGDPDSYDISVFRNANTNPLYMFSQGIANSQYVNSLLGVRSAGNRFNNQAAAAGYPYHNYYKGSNTNNTFQYKYSTAPLPISFPTYSNIIANCSPSTPNTCPIVAPLLAGMVSGGSKPPYIPFNKYTASLAQIETQIILIEKKSSMSGADSTDLDGLYTAQALLMDTVITYYQLSGNTDSIALAYGASQAGWWHKVMQAQTYISLGRYADAISLVNGISGSYRLSTDEQTAVSHLADMYAALQWLHDHAGNWAGMPATLKQPVYDYEDGDALYAGTIARALLTQYEGRTYEPEYVLPQRAASRPTDNTLPDTGEHIYPNPFSNALSIAWNGAPGILIVTDVNGKTALTVAISQPNTTIATNKLPAGMYIAVLKVDGVIAYKQKLVKE